MKNLLLLLLLALFVAPVFATAAEDLDRVQRDASSSTPGANGTRGESAATLDAQSAERFAALALACVHKEYPNKISHVLDSNADVAPPRELTPAFYGCYDWHSSVHGHWLLARLARTYPDASFAQTARAALARSLTAANVAKEAAYLSSAGRTSFLLVWLSYVWDWPAVIPHPLWVLVVRMWGWFCP